MGGRITISPLRIMYTLNATTDDCTGYGCVSCDDDPDGAVQRGIRWTSTQCDIGRNCRLDIHGPLSVLL